MNESKHTPGPWRVFGPKADPDAVIEYDDDFLIVGPSTDDPEYAPVPAICNNEANARLISAAPDLLAACEEALSWAESSIDAQYSGCGDLLKRKLEELDFLRAAIAKARGDAQSPHNSDPSVT